MSITNLEFFGDRLKYAREQRKLNTTELGELVGVSQGHISHLEKGRRQATRPLAVSLAEVLGIRSEWLINNVEPMYEDIVEFDFDKTATQFVNAEMDKLGFSLHPSEIQSLQEWIVGQFGDLQIELDKRIKAYFIEDQNKDEQKQLANPDISATNVISGNFKNEGGDVFLGGNKIITQKHTTRVINQPPEGSISEMQSRQIQEHLIRIGGLESERMGQAAYGITQNQFKKKFSITSYKNLPVERFSEAIDYLEKREKIAEKNLMNSGKNPVTRNEFIRRIQTISRKELKWTDTIRKEKLMARFGKASLTELSINEMEDFYKYISGLKKK